MKQMWKLLALVLVIATLFTFGGCTEQPDGSQETQGSVDTPFDPENPHLLLATDIQNGCLAVINLDEEDPMDPDSYYWYWKADPALGWQYANKLALSLSDARLRWSEIHQSYVVLMTAASGWIGIAEYPSGKCLWETTNTGNGPHAIEMLPNGDVVVANSGGTSWASEGTLMYYHTTDGKNWSVTDTVSLQSAHGVLWDPQYNVLWANSYSKLVAYKIETGDDGGNVLSIVDEMGGRLSSGGGHDLMPDYHDKDLLWITVEHTVRKFSKSQNKFINDYDYADQLRSQARVKGITSFSDGTVAYSRCGATSSEWLNTFYVLTPQDTEVTLVEYTAQDSAYWNKVRNFNPYYQ